MEGPLLLQRSSSVPSGVAPSFSSYRDIERHDDDQKSVQLSPGPWHYSTPFRSTTSPPSDIPTPMLASTPGLHTKPDLLSPVNSAPKTKKPSKTTRVIEPSVFGHRNVPYPTVSSATRPSCSTTTTSSKPYRPVSPPPSSIDRHSSFWSKENDELLMQARQKGLNWQPIASTYFPSKTPNACRKRHERLMEKRNNADDWDGVKMEMLARAYNHVREQMWRLLADKVGVEEWQIVESKCMEKGLKTLQAAGRTDSRRDHVTQHSGLGGGLGSDLEDFLDLHPLSPNRVGPKSYPNSDDGFNDSAIGPDTERPFVEHDSGSCNLQSLQHDPSSNRSYPRSSTYPSATPSSELIRSVLPPQAFSNVFSAPISYITQVPSELQSQSSSSGATLPSSSAGSGIPDTFGVGPHESSTINMSKNGRFHEDGLVSKISPSKDSSSDLLISSKQKSANLNMTISGHIANDESSPMRCVTHKEILEDRSGLKSDPEEPPNREAITAPQAARPEDSDLEHDLKLCGVRDKGIMKHEIPNYNEQGMVVPASSMVQSGQIAHHERSRESTVEASNVSNAHVSEEVGSEGTCSIDDRSPLSDNGVSHLELLHAKHMLVADIMRDVYSLFDAQWSDCTRTCTSYGNEKSGARLSSNDQGPRSTSTHKRKSDDLDPEQPDDGNGRKRKSHGARQPDQGFQSRLYACPFNKFDPQRFCVTTGTGQKYRTCWRPGFDSIARLRQHLRRKHKAPVQCSRCWITLSTVQELSQHTNEEQRCHQRPPKEEGINQDKMELIESQWGARWEQIYEIIFPGAPVPHPYIEETLPQFEESHDSSPAAQSFREYNDYSRVALPMAVEASLRAIVHSKMAPIEEEVKVLVVDIVRRCQSTVAQDYQQAQRLKNVLAQSSDATPTVGQSASPPDLLPDLLPDPHKSYMPDAANSIFANALTHYQEPPFSDFDIGLTPPSYSRSTPQKQASDSGYGTTNSPCTCHCHAEVGSSTSSIDTRDCDFCAAKHAEPELTAYKDFDKLFDT